MEFLLSHPDPNVCALAYFDNKKVQIFYLFCHRNAHKNLKKPPSKVRKFSKAAKSVNTIAKNDPYCPDS